jgi:hypothetical protein
MTRRSPRRSAKRRMRTAARRERGSLVYEVGGVLKARRRARAACVVAVVSRDDHRGIERGSSGYR